jgi:hypothetical protein
MIEEDERADHAALGAGQHAAHREARSQLVGVALDKKLDRIGHVVLLVSPFGKRAAPVGGAIERSGGYGARLVPVNNPGSYPVTNQ